MKYMHWRDLEPGDVLQVSDELLEYYKYSPTFYDRFKDTDLTIRAIKFTPQWIKIYDQFSDGYWTIGYDGTDTYRTKILTLKIIKLKETL